MTDLSGVTAVVTGGNSGIGRAMAIGMARTVSELGPLGCLVANAGVTDGAPITEMSLERADPTLVFHTGNEVVVDGGYTVY